MSAVLVGAQPPATLRSVRTATIVSFGLLAIPLSGCAADSSVNAVAESVAGKAITGLAAGTWSCTDSRAGASGTIVVGDGVWTLDAKDSDGKPWAASGTWIVSSTSLTVQVQQGSSYPGPPDGASGTAVGQFGGTFQAGSTLSFGWTWSPSGVNSQVSAELQDGALKLSRIEGGQTYVTDCSRS